MTVPIPDEEQPLLTTQQDVKHTGVLVDFEDNDPRNPRAWSKGFKWGIVMLLAGTAFTVTFTCIGLVPIASSIVDDLDGRHASSSTSVLLVTIWELGEAGGPLLIAPLSELYGRYPVINICNILFISATILAAMSQTTNLLIAARMLTGIAVASNVLNPAIVGDMFESEERGSPMSMLMLAPLLGGAIGPAIAGAIAQTLGWRVVLLIAASLAVVCEVLFLTCFKETYKMAILRRSASKVQRESGEFAKGDVEEQAAPEGSSKIWHSITRPAAVLFGSGVLMALCTFAAVAFSYFYVLAVSLPVILQDIYHLTPAQTGSAFMFFSFGSFTAVLVCNFYLDRIYIKLRGDQVTGKPENRLPIAIVGALSLPISIIAYGWIAELKLPIWLLLTSVSVLGFTLLLGVLPLFAYVVDACGNYSASAMTGVIVTRCLMSTFLPLVTGPLAEHLGYGWGYTVLAGVSWALAVIPILIFRYGHVWRQRSEYTKDQ